MTGDTIVCCAIIHVALTNSRQVQKNSSASQSQKDPPTASGTTLKIRVVTPELARIGDLDSIKVLRDPVPLSCSLKKLKSRVQQHVGFSADDGACPELDCNCKVARQIDDNAVLNERGSGDYEASHTVILVHGNNDVVALPVSELTMTAFQETANKYLAKPNKILTVIGGVEHTKQIIANKRYLKAPVLAICSRDQHSTKRPTRTGDASPAAEGRDLIVDIHTLECPIELTAHNADITLADVGLEDCAIDGVLNIFAIERWTNGQMESVHGKAGIFKKSDSWELPNGQSDRGMSNLLSTLRVFSHLTSGGAMKEAQQDAILHMIHLLTRFPPAVRAAYIIMRGETPRPPERAALVQCLYEVLKDVVPLRIVHSNTKRLLEGSRLLFGLILEKAKNLKVSKNVDDAQLP
jgi:hypothetical protein